MSASYADALTALYPTVSWLMTDNNDYSTLNWNSDTVQKPTEQELKDECALLDLQAPLNVCKQQASKLLYETDWTTIADVADPVKSNPYLINSAEFNTYRNAVRQYAINPVADPVFPVKPTSQWSS
jgi:hypothetical protein